MKRFLQGTSASTVPAQVPRAAARPRHESGYNDWDSATVLAHNESVLAQQPRATQAEMEKWARDVAQAQRDLREIHRAAKSGAQPDHKRSIFGGSLEKQILSELETNKKLKTMCREAGRLPREVVDDVAAKMENCRDMPEKNRSMMIHKVCREILIPKIA